MDISGENTSNKENQIMFTISRTTTSRKGLYAQNNYKRGSIVFTLRGGKEYDAPAPNTIEVDYGVHVEHQWGKYLTHSAEPNVVVMGYLVIASKDIKEGELICSYFPQHETTLNGEFEDDDFYTVSVTLGDEDMYIGAP